MIKFYSLQIENFLSVSDAHLHLEGQGLVLIEGINEDDPTAKSNGAGKSSIVDAISWGLFGETARGASGDSVVNLKAGKNCRVVLHLAIDGVDYIIDRGRKHKTLKNRVELRQDTATGFVDLTLGTDKLTQEKINNLLGCTPDIFNAAIYMGQEAMPDLPSMTDKALKAILEQALSLDKLDDALEVCKERYATAFHVATTAHNELRLLESTFKNAEEEIDRYEQSIERAEGEAESIKDEIAGGQIAFVSKHVTYQKGRAALETALDAIPEIDIATINNKVLAEVDGILEEKRELEKKADKVSRHLTDVIVEMKQHAKVMNGVETKCPTCNREHDHAEEAQRILGEATKAHADLDLKRAKLEDMAIKLHNDAKEVERRAQAHQVTAMAAYGADLKERNAIAAQIIELDKAHNWEDAGWKSTRQALERALTTKEKLIAEGKVVLDKYIADAAISRIQIAEATDTRDLANARLDMLDKVKYIMGRKGFRGEVLDQITPFLNARTSHYLTQLTDGNITAVWNTITTNASGDYVENFHIAVQHASGVNKFANLSGGEKRKVRLATAMAMQDLVGTRAVKPIKLFVADEIDDAIDEAGLELLMGLLEDKAREVGTVFIISHNDISDWVRNKITVVKRDGQSTFKAP